MPPHFYMAARYHVFYLVLQMNSSQVENTIVRLATTSDLHAIHKLCQDEEWIDSSTARINVVINHGIVFVNSSPDGTILSE